MSGRVPISIPASIRWREFRQGILPYLTFALVAGCAVVLWNKRLAPSVIVGQAESVRVVVTTAKPGIVASLQVDLLQRVKQGDILAHIVPNDLEVVTADLHANLEALRAQLRQTSDRNTVNYQELRLDWLRRNVELASARVEQQLAESDFQRYAALHANRSVSDADMEIRRANRDGLRHKVTALEQLSTDLEKEIARMTPNAAEPTPAERAISAAVVAQHKQLEALSAASTLRAPMDGIVTLIAKRPGENTLPGDPLLTVGALAATRIVGFVRQPLNTTVKIGDTLAVASRTAQRSTASARVLGVGTQLELIDPSLLPASASALRVAEYGLPVLLEIPAALHLAPGEIVNITPRSRL